MLYQLSYAPMKLFSNEKAALSLSGWAASQLALALFAPPPRLPVPLTRAQIVGSRNRGQHDTAARHEPRGFGVGVLQHGELLGLVGTALLIQGKRCADRMAMDIPSCLHVTHGRL